MKLHTKAKKYCKRVLLTLLIFIISFSILSMAVTVIYFHTAYPRTDKLSRFSYAYADMEEKGYHARKIQFMSSENTLSGYCYEAEDAKALVVISAGFGDSGASHLGEMMAFVDAGFTVFCYDATGVGESEGKSRGGLSQPAGDLQSALDCIAADRKLSRLPILLYGHSAGGYAAAVCADEPSVKAAVILCPFESPTRLMRESARRYVGFLCDVEYPFIVLENNLLFSSALNQNASDCIKRADIPIAIFEGADDTTIPESERLSAHLDLSDSSAITVTVCEEGSRSGHYGIWLSEEAQRYRKSLGKNTLPNADTANMLDEEFIRDVIAFYYSAVQ